ncbi:class II fructose-bisphosphate aldolase [Spiroplasma endosymbiont of Dasysyrphus albostriatus]|uniref:class II fructose-bisphosphate aldolase n=1 Tax=Spiroplasma endosymbiont of Dasysyrphus albostriatus TaxID=3066299 RepID=UPI00279F2809|nr:MAG: class II fructose-1,6-bisphosphate aldolase [Spiroplasma endosymbiont of Drosophila atripex]
MKINLKTMLKHAQINKYAIPSFNFDNLEMLIAITNAAEKQKAPICLMITPNTINCIDLKYVLAITNNVINRAKVPIFLQLDHCLDPHFIKTKITSDFSSVMLNYSNYPIKENIEKTKDIVHFAAPLGIVVESEIFYNNTKGDITNDINLIEQAILFRNKTNINGLVFTAINSHHQDNRQDLKISLIKEIAIKMPEIFLVLHDNVTINNEQLALAIKAGITKVNISSDLRKIYVESLKKSLQTNSNLSNINTLIENAMIAIQKFVEEKIILLGANNRYKF